MHLYNTAFVHNVLRGSTMSPWRSTCVCFAVTAVPLCYTEVLCKVMATCPLSFAVLLCCFEVLYELTAIHLVIFKICLCDSPHRIIWGKCMNCGQICLSPDYVLVDAAVVTPLLAAVSSDQQYLIHVLLW
jgi:hypothetical protein